MDYKRIIEPLLQEAGTIALKYWRGSFESKLKEDGSDVTAADYAVSDFFLVKLREAFAEHRVLTEEEMSGASGDAPIWVVDPIDGTSFFKSGSDNWQIMLCLLDPKPVFSMIYRPAKNEWYWAERGKGAHWRRGDETGVFVPKYAQSPPRAEHGTGARSRGAEVVPDIVKGVLDILEGNLDLYGEKSPGSWDVWPPGLLLLECRGVLLDKQGNNLVLEDPTKHYDDIVIGWPEAIKELKSSQ